MSEKSTTTGYLLWFFLGGFGAHRFYYGKKGSGIGMAALTVGSTILSAVVIGLLGFPVLMAWWIYDAFQISKWNESGAATAGSIGAVGPTPGYAPSPIPNAAETAASYEEPATRAA